MLLTKRRRTESTRSNAPPPTKRTESTTLHELLPPAPELLRSEIWFDDGNIIVQAENTQFRLFKGALCSSSDVFKDLVEDMADLTAEDGSPLLLLTDSAAELTYVLRTIFHRWSYPPNQPLAFDVIAAFLRLGRKYEMKPLYDDALARLVPRPDDPNRRGQIVVDTIILARELDIPSLLPAAFWFTCTRLESLANKHTSAISDADRDVILLAAKPLSIAYASYLFGWLDETPANCSQPAVCSNTKLKYSLKQWKPPGSAMTLYWRSSAESGLCRTCVAAGQKHHSEGAKRLWAELPVFFNLPPWGEMLANAPAAIADYAVSRVNLAPEYALSRVSIASPEHAMSRVNIASPSSESAPSRAALANNHNRRFTSTGIGMGNASTTDVHATASTSDIHSSNANPSPDARPGASPKYRFPKLRRAMSVFGGGGK
ncbi:hypothetical protein B0H16DRAFT_1757026 [Mycena metata]|uniref:BTB domain-containing protein n=1 Tax=Mycena metata TaxID=1033252 RepID=A0AAD7K2E3_9AGAR|nr:hypothetical protein B0H16DRAFT_1757026 [Mycena metata]